MAQLDEEEDVVNALTGFQDVGLLGDLPGFNMMGTNASNEVNPSNTGFMGILKDVFKAGGLIQYGLRKAGLPPSTEGKTPAQVHLINRRGRGFFKNADGSWNTTHPQTGEPRKHRMVDMPFFGEVPVGPPVEIDDTTPFMLQHDSRPEINSEMLADKRRLWDLWLLTGQQQYLDQYNNAESNPKWA